MMNVSAEALALLEAIDPAIAETIKGLDTPVKKFIMYGQDGNVLPPGAGGFGGPPGAGAAGPKAATPTATGPGTPPAPPTPEAGPVPVASGPGGPRPAAGGGGGGAPPAGGMTGPGGIVTRWFRVQQALYERLDPGIVQLGVKVRRYDLLGPDPTDSESEDARVRIQYEIDGGRPPSEREARTLDAKILVGADGINSAVRLQLLKGPGAEGFTGDWAEIGLSEPDSIIVRGMVEATDFLTADDAEQDETLKTLQSGESEGVSRWFFGQQKGIAFIIRFKDFLSWSYTVPLERIRSSGQYDVRFDATSRPVLIGGVGTDSEYCPLLRDAVLEIVAAALGEASEFGRLMSKAVSITPERAISMHVYATTTDPTKVRMGDGHMTLVGDSAHAMGPTGVGLTLSAQDAYVLARQLRDKGFEEAALRAYEEERRGLLKQVLDKTRAGHQAVLGPDTQKGLQMWTDGSLRRVLNDSTAHLEPLVPLPGPRGGGEEEERNAAAEESERRQREKRV